MKSIYPISLILSLLILFSLTGCLDDDSGGGSETLQGNVNLFDDGQNTIANDDMAVTVLGTLPVISDTTVSDGSFRLENIPTGVFTLLFKKEGFGTFRIFNYPVGLAGASRPDLTRINLGQISSTVTTAIQDSIVGEDIFLIVDVDPAGTPDRPRFVRIFFNQLGNAGPEENRAFSGVLETESDQLIFAVSRTDLLDVGFQLGQTVFARAYGESFYANDYEDPTLDRRVFPNLNPNAADPIFFQVP